MQRSHRNSRDDKSSKNKSSINKSGRARINPDKPDKSNSTSEEKFGERRPAFKKDSKQPDSGRRDLPAKGSYKTAGSRTEKKGFNRRPDADEKERSTNQRSPGVPRGDSKFSPRRTDASATAKRTFGERNDSSFKKSSGDKQGSYKKPFNREGSADRIAGRYKKEEKRWTSEERISSGNRPKKPNLKADDGLIRLNRYIANAGICSRRKADELIAAGVVSVNGQVTSELGLKVDPFKDEIRYNGQLLKREKMVYVLLNKPKDYITTTDDPQERRTVMQLVEKASKERIYPVGRLDRNTTGLLLMTNDGDLADKLSHPRNNITKIYQAELNKNLTQGDLNKIAFGLELEDGLIKPDVVSYVQGGTKREIGIQIHSGKNRIVRRIFEHLGYEVVKLDRVVYANLTKKDLPRGRWRYLEEKEVIQLKHLMH